MNKKAVIAYIVLIIFGIAMYFYVRANLSSGITISNQKTTSTVTTTLSNNTNSTGLIIVSKSTTTSNFGQPVVITENSTPAVINVGYGVISPGNNYSSNHGINGSSLSSCIAYGGFTCSNLFLSSATGNLTFTFSEQQYPVWTKAEIFLLNPTSAPRPKNNFVNVSQEVIIENISNSEQITITMPAIKPGLPKGTQISGNIWAIFHTEATNSTYLSEVAQFSAQSI
ncbi:MAG: hypothetical protein ACP5M9_00435 [Candidatus Micrarchaeia archaeon]